MDVLIAADDVLVHDAESEGHALSAARETMGLIGDKMACSVNPATVDACWATSVGKM